MLKKCLVIIGILILIALIGFASWGPIVSNVPEPDYEVISSSGDIQIREYDPMIVAEVTTEGERYEAINKGFRILADYIFGNNVKSQSISMTAPVIQESGEKIAMTAPVLQEETSGKWITRFVMPPDYTMQMLPKPINETISIKEMPARRFAVIRFSGLNTDKNLAKHEEKLQAYILENNLQPISAPIFAFYNPPWTLPFLRRNEVMIQIQTD